MSHRLNTRSGSRQTLQANRSNNHIDGNSEVIILSSGDEGPSVPKKRPRPNLKRSANLRAKARTPVVVPQDTIIISSDDETAPSKSRSDIVALQKQVKALQEENARLRRQATRVQTPAPAVLSELLQAAEKSKQKLLTTLDDDLCCEICTLRMWTPFTLGCGHTFCQTCLQDWFNTTLAKYMEENPGYNPNPPHVQRCRYLLRQERLDPHSRQHILESMRAVLKTMKHPTYTCPSCRTVVSEKPAEVYALKQVVRTIAEARGETSPKKTLPPRGSKDIGGPWDGFFPAIPV